MPHFVLEYSGNLDTRVDFKTLASLVHATIMSTGISNWAPYVLRRGLGYWRSLAQKCLHRHVIAEEGRKKCP